MLLYSLQTWEKDMKTADILQQCSLMAEENMLPVRGSNCSIPLCKVKKKWPPLLYISGHVFRQDGNDQFFYARILFQRKRGARQNIRSHVIIENGRSESSLFLDSNKKTMINVF